MIEEDRDRFINANFYQYTLLLYTKKDLKQNFVGSVPIWTDIKSWLSNKINFGLPQSVEPTLSTFSRVLRLICVWKSKKLQVSKLFFLKPKSCKQKRPSQFSRPKERKNTYGSLVKKEMNCIGVCCLKPDLWAKKNLGNVIVMVVNRNNCKAWLLLTQVL